MASYSLSEVAKQLNCNESTVHRAVKKNKLNIKKVGNKRRFSSGNIAKLKALIRNKEDDEKTQSNAPTPHDNLKGGVITNDLIKELREQIQELKADKEHYRKELEAQRELLEKLGTTINEINRTVLGTMYLTSGKSGDNQVIEAEPQKTKKPAKKENWLHKIFYKDLF